MSRFSVLECSQLKSTQPSFPGPLREGDPGNEVACAILVTQGQRLLCNERYMNGLKI